MIHKAGAMGPRLSQYTAKPPEGMGGFVNAGEAVLGLCINCQLRVDPRRR